jgi:hypothetical protein
MITAPVVPTENHGEEPRRLVDFSGESWEGGMAAQLYEGVWSIGDHHTPALVAGLPIINNRCFVFRLKDVEDGDFLLAIGVAGNNAIQGLQALARDMKLPVRFVLSQGANHHMFLERWYEEFPEARILIPGRKIPVSRNGRALQQKYPDRWEVYNDAHLGIPALLKYQDQLDFAIFDQFYGIRDHDFTSESHKCRVNIGPLEYGLKFTAAKRDQLMDAIWTYHKASGICIYEHNVDIWLTKEQHSKLPFPVIYMMAPERFQSALPETFSWVQDPKIHYETWQKVLGWEITTLVDYHMDPGTCLQPQNNTNGGASTCRQLIEQLIAKSGEDDPTGYNLWYNRRNRQIRQTMSVVLVGIAAYLLYQYTNN